MNLKDIKCDWINNFSNPLMIAGPCSAESEQQIFSSAERI